MTFDDNLKAITQDELLPKVVDTVSGANVITLRFLSNMKAWRGETLSKPIKISSAGNGGSFSGFDKFNTNSSDTKVKASADVRANEQPVVIGGLEKDVNASSDRSVDLVAEAIEEAANEMADSIGGLLYGDGTGNSNKDFLGLAAGIDDGGEVDTYLNISRSTYSTWQANETDVGGSLTRAAMATMYDSCRVGTDKPTLILTTESIWSDYEALAAANINIDQDGYRQLTATGVTRALKGELGFDSLSFRGVPVVADEKCPSGTMWFINERHYAFYGLKSTMDGYTQIKIAGNKEIEGYYGDEAPVSAGFAWSGFLKPIDQYAQIGHIILLGNFVTFNPNRHGVLNTIS